MKEALEAQRVTSIVTLVDVLPGRGSAAPAILTSSRMRLKSGGERTVTEKIPVLDAALWDRLTSEVSKGDELRIAVETDWADPDLPTWLADFAVVSAPLAPATVR
jgi:hypothetical protein